MLSKPKQESISCIILAGGEGKRFNREDKGLVKLNNKPLIEHIINTIGGDVDDIVISANRNHDTYKQYSNTVVNDKENDYQGPLSGIIACLPFCKHEWVLIIPCDIPTLPSDLTEKLITSDHNPLVVAKAHGQRQLVLLLHKSLTSSIETYLKEGRRKVMTWIDLQNPTVINFKDATENHFININTPNQLN